MEIYKNIEIIDLGLYLRDYGILVIADTQIGYEESLNKQGVMVPRFQYRDLIKRIEKIKPNEKNKFFMSNINSRLHQCLHLTQQ